MLTGISDQAEIERYPFRPDEVIGSVAVVVATVALIALMALTFRIVLWVMVSGFFAIVLMDQIRNTLRRTDDVETKLGRPLLTAIPKLSGASTR